MMERYVEVTQRQAPGLLDVLASIYFTLGRVEEAIATATEAAEKARAAGANELAADIEARLVEYRAASTNRPRT
jgi:hypothetical protein